MKTTAKFLTLLGLLLLLASLALTLSACGGNGSGSETPTTDPGPDLPPECVHQWTAADCTHAATCTRCGATEGEALGHDWHAATCDAPKTCGRCGDTEGEALGHDWHAATCDAPKTCGHCGATEGEALGHDWTYVPDGAGHHIAVCSRDPENHTKTEDCSGGTATCSAQAICDKCGGAWGQTAPHTYDCRVAEGDYLCAPATCTTRATYYFSCACGACGTETFVVGEELGHHHELTGSTAADCTHAATETYTCTHAGCADTFTREVGQPLGHALAGVSPTEIHVQGCEYAYTYHCPACDTDVPGEHIFHHVYKATVTPEATCVSDGVKTFVCDGCGDTYTEKIPADPSLHVWDEGTVSGQIRTYHCTCQGCDATKTAVNATDTTSAAVSADDLQNAGGIELKNAGMAFDEDALSTLAGKDVIISSDTLEGEALQNALSALTPEQKAQLGEDPVIYDFRICEGEVAITEFGGTVTVTLPYTLKPGDNADCIAVWYISGDTPVAIEATYHGGYVTFETDHFSNYTVTDLTPEETCEVYGHRDHVTVFAGSCTEDGYIMTVCERCHRVLWETTSEAHGHDYACVTTPATCTRAGSCVYTCSVCHHVYTEILPATGHDWQVSQTVTATCAHGGKTVYVCAHDGCAASYEVTTPSLPHSWGEETVAPTCTARGYVLHTCSECGYTYQSDFTPATGHSWSTVTVPATCLEEGYVTYVCAHCEQSYIGARLAPAGHDLHAEWIWDEATHTARVTVTCAHDCGLTAASEGTVTSVAAEATCQRAASVTYTARAEVLGRIWEDSVTHTVGEPVGHEYRDGVCIWCGHRAEGPDCDHTHMTEHILHTEDYGCCEGYCKYSVCDCGEVVVLAGDSDDSFFRCPIVPEMTEDVDEDGNPRMTVSGTCSVCGMRILTTAVAIRVSPCTQIQRQTVSIWAPDGTPLLANAQLEYTYTYHEHNVERLILLSDFGACGGTLTVYECTDCGEIVSAGLEDFEPACPITYVETMEELPGGNIHARREGTCPDCGLHVLYDGTLVYETSCTYVITETLTVTRGEEEIVSSVNTTHGGSHDWGDYTYTLLGETCDDGIFVERTCTVCGFVDSYITYGHERCDEKVDLGDVGCCPDCYITEIRCAVCGELRGLGTFEPCAHSSDYLPSIEWDGRLWQGWAYGCSDCHRAFLRLEGREATGVPCEYRVQRRLVIADADSGEILFDRTYDCGLTHEHTYEYSYQFLGQTCEGGYVVSAHCTVCGGTETYRGQGHRYADTEVDLRKICGCCDGRIRVSACEICGETGYCNVDACAMRSGMTETVEIEVGGVRRTAEKRVCSKCGLTCYVWSDELPAEGCTVVREVYYRLEMDGREVYTCHGRRTEERHDWQDVAVEYKNGYDCEDGVTVTRRCAVCGAVTHYSTWDHEECCTHYDLAEYDLCGGFLEVTTCRICGHTLDIYVWLGECSSTRTEREYVDDNGYEHYHYESACSKCGVTVVQDEYFIPSAECPCEGTQCWRLTLVRDDAELLCLAGEEPASIHEWQDEYRPMGEDCERDGVTVVSQCPLCGATETREHFGHIWETKTYDLSEAYGICEGVVRTTFCLACGRVEGTQWLKLCCERWGMEEYEKEKDDGTVVRMRTGICPDCGLTVTEEWIPICQNGCTCTYCVHRVLIWQGEVIFEADVTTMETRHVWGEPEVHLHGTSCEEGVEVLWTCIHCEETMEESWGHHEPIITDEEIPVCECGTCGGTLLYRHCACGEVRKLWWKQDKASSLCYEYYEENGRSGDRYFCPECGLTLLVLRDYQTQGCYRAEVADYFVLCGETPVREILGVTVGGYFNHDWEILNRTLLGESCDDGYLATMVCTRCHETWEDTCYGHVWSDERTYVLLGETCEDGVECWGRCLLCGCWEDLNEYFSYHRVVKSEEIRPAGYARGQVPTIEAMYCACGECREYKILDCCGSHWVGTPSSYFDGDGVEHLVETLCYEGNVASLLGTRDECFRYYGEGCEGDAVICWTFYFGDEVLFTFVETQESTRHDWHEVCVLDKPGGSCTDGVSVRMVCSRCGDFYEAGHYEDHMGLTVTEQISAADLGARCDGYVEIQSCACGQYHEVAWDRLECDLYQYSYYSEALAAYVNEFVCAVTDPEPCPMRILFYNRNRQIEGTCYACYHSVWLLGYDPETGTAVRTVTSDSAPVSVEHDWDETHTEQTLAGGLVVTDKKTCTRCGVYETEQRTYDADGHLIEYDQQGTTLFLPGYSGNVAYHVVERFDAEGRILYELSESTDEEGNVKANESVYDYSYQAPWGTDSYQVSSHISNRWENYIKVVGYTTFVGSLGNRITKEVFSETQAPDGTVMDRTTCTFLNGCCHYIERREYADGTVTEDEWAWHGDSEYVQITEPTCAVCGTYVRKCSFCGEEIDSGDSSPTGHSWYYDGETGDYCCSQCGQHNVKGVYGSVFFEILSEDDETAVAVWGECTYDVYLVLWLDAGETVVARTVVLGTLAEDVRGGTTVTFSAAQAVAEATARGYAEGTYVLKLTAVPADGSLEYGLVFSESGAISD